MIWWCECSPCALTWSALEWGSSAGGITLPDCSAEAYRSGAACSKSYSHSEFWKTEEEKNKTCVMSINAYKATVSISVLYHSVVEFSVLIGQNVL